MPGLKKICLLALPVILAASVIFAAPFFFKTRLHDTLAAYGLADALIGDWKPDPGAMVFSDITLDQNGFNTIESIKAQVNWLAPISGRFFPRITIDNLLLTGDISEQGLLSLGGWNLEKLQPASSVPQTLVLNGGRLELYTPEGGLVLNGKGRIEKAGHLAINMAAWGEQHQVTVDTRWQIAYFSPRKWRSEVEIRDLRLNLADLQCSRVNGWLTATRMPEDAPGTLPVLSGQVTAGTIRIGEKSALQNVIVTFSGAGSTIITAESGNYKGVQVILEITSHDGRHYIKSTLSGKQIRDIMAFLQEFSTDIEKGTGNRVNLVTLLLTPGNIERIENKIARIAYDDLEVIIKGEPGDLTGKILARKKKNGAYVTNVISMNPGG